MKNIKLTLEYDGSRYQGWSRLGKGESTNTISNKLTEVIEKMTGESIELFCGARTEVGVHAYAQIVNFKTCANLTMNQIKQYLNRYLPMDIAITEVEFMPERFHAKLNAKSKTYIYRIAISDVPSVFDRRYMYHSFKKPDIALMKEAALQFLGIHNFKYFTTARQNKSSEREIYGIDIYGDAEEIQITIHASDFLHNMQRLMIGTLLDIGLGNRSVDDISKIFSGKAEPSAPCDPKGLYLQEIEY